MSGDWRADVLKFWFGLDPKQWWKSDPALDHQIKQHFLKLWAEKRQLPVDSFLHDPLTALAGVILFDQFSRNMVRGHADAYSTDTLALAIAKGAVERRFDEKLQPDERKFLYMPFQHSEDLRTRTGRCFCQNRRAIARLCQAPRVIEVRPLPHRNAMLGVRRNAVTGSDIVERGSGVFPTGIPVRPRASVKPGRRGSRPSMV